MEKGIWGSRKQFFLQVADMVTNGIILNILPIIAPHLLIDLRISHHPSGVGGKETQDIKLLGCQTDLPPIPENLPAVRVDFKPWNLQCRSCTQFILFEVGMPFYNLYYLFNNICFIIVKFQYK